MKYTTTQIIEAVKEEGYGTGTVKGNTINFDGFEVSIYPYEENGKDHTEYVVKGSTMAEVGNFRKSSCSHKNMEKTVKTLRGIVGAVNYLFERI